MPSNKPGSRLIRAAGGVAWRPGPDGEPEILLVHRKKYDDWSLPKGKAEPGEALPVTAVREVLEEGGARLALGFRRGLPIAGALFGVAVLLAIVLTRIELRSDMTDLLPEGQTGAEWHDQKSVQQCGQDRPM